MSWKRNTFLLLTAATFLFGMVGCGTSQETEEVSVDSSATTTIDPRSIQPDIHTNLPPPSPESEKILANRPLLDDQAAESFFEKKKVIESFSDGLKERIQKSLAEVEPVDEASGEGPVFFTMMGSTSPVPEDPNCNPTNQFLCIDAPQPADGADEVFTPEAGLDVYVRMDLNSLAVFSSLDPVAVVTVFNNDTGGAASEVLVMPEEVEAVGSCTEASCVGRFHTAVGLGGGGQFTIVVSAYRSLDSGEGNELFSKMVTVYRTVAPELSETSVVAIPIRNGEEGEPVEDGAVIVAESLKMKVGLSSAYSPGIQILFENFDENGTLRSYDVVGYVSSKQAGIENGERVYTGQFFLHQGLNDVRIVAANPELEAIMGAEAPPRQELQFQVQNYAGNPRIRILSPNPAAPVVPQTAQNGQKVDLQFCYTLIPDQLGPEDLTSPPDVNSQECLAGNFGFNVCVLVNGRQIQSEEDFRGDTLECDVARGICTARITPDLGVNLYEIRAIDEDCASPISSNVGSFIYGQPVPLIENGQVAQAETFTKRGLNIDIDSSLISGPVKDMIAQYANQPAIGDFVLNTFKSESVSPARPCNEVNPPSVSGGSTSVEFIPETFSLGPIEITKFETMADGMLHLGAKINGMHGEADMIDLNGPVVTYDDQVISFIPLTFSIAQLEINLGVTFRKDVHGNLKLDLREIPGQKLVNIIGDGPLGNFVSVNSDRNPFASGLEFLDQQQGLVKDQFRNTLYSTFVCGIENGVNYGVLDEGVRVIEDPLNEQPSGLRLNFPLDLLGQVLNLNLAINPSKGDVKIDSEGLHIRRIALRGNPGPRELLKIAETYPQGVIGSVGQFKVDTEASPQLNITSQLKPLGILLSEDVINQLLFAANLSGLLSLDIDANFYAAGGSAPSSFLQPNGSMFLTQGIDVNQDGNTNNDDEVPVLLRIQSDRRQAPMLTFLSNSEVQVLSDKEDLVLEAGDTAGSEEGVERKKYFDVSKSYFRLAVSGLELSAYQQEPKPEAGVRTFCSVPLPDVDNTTLEAKGFCKISSEARSLVDPALFGEGFVCPEEDIVTIAGGAGKIVSRRDLNAEADSEPAPLYRVRIGLVAHGELLPVSQEVNAADRLFDPNPPQKNIFRLKFVPANTGVPEGFVTAVEVVENHTAMPSAQIARIIADFLKAAIGSDCNAFNEIKIPIPDRFPSDPSQHLLPDFGVDYLDLGSTQETLPEVFIDDNRLFLDLLLFADLHLNEEGADTSSDEMEMLMPRR